MYLRQFRNHSESTDKKTSHLVHIVQIEGLLMKHYVLCSEREKIVLNVKLLSALKIQHCLDLIQINFHTVKL